MLRVSTNRYNFLFTLSVFIFIFSSCKNSSAPNTTEKPNSSDSTPAVNAEVSSKAVLDTVAYNRQMEIMANGDTSGLWPVKGPHPKPGAIFPFKRVVAYYGNLLSTRMGALGEFPEDEMLNKLQAEVRKWEQADTTTPVVPALHYIAVVAHAKPGNEGRYILRMPFAQIDTILRMASRINALVFLDIQIALSSLQREVPYLEKYLKMPNVHFGIDPEFSMKGGQRPGTVIGSFNADDINYVTGYLGNLVKKYDLPPKILVLHRFTEDMIKNYKGIRLSPEVQIVMDMDGWGEMKRKIGTYYRFVHAEPVQFTGFKIFYKNDTKKVNAPREMQPEDVLKLMPRPIYIQYQ